MKDHTRELDVYKFDHERNPFKKIRLFFARRRFAKQRAHKGFCDWDMWDLDTFWSQLFIDSLTEFKEKSDGIPGCFILEDGTTDDQALEKCHKIIDEIIDGFKFYQVDELDVIHDLSEYQVRKYELTGSWELDTPEEKKLYDSAAEATMELNKLKQEKIKHSFELLAKYFGHFWW